MNEKQLLEELRPLVSELVAAALVNKVIAKLPNIINKPGHYIILSDKPVPEVACKSPNYKIGDLYCWYNGTSRGIRGRIRNHLHRKDLNAQLSSSSGIAVETILRADIPLDKNLAYFKKVNEDGSVRFLNGIQSNYPANFWIAEIESEYLDSVIEKMFREEYGVPPLCQYTNR